MNIFEYVEQHQASGEDAETHGKFSPDEDWLAVHQGEIYSAYAKDIGFMWHWVICRDGEAVQEGCSLSLETARRSVGHVLAFYSIAEKNIGGAAED